MSNYGGSPIMSYGGDNDVTGGFCPDGYELNTPVVILVIIVIAYFLGFFDQFLQDQIYDHFYVDLQHPKKEGTKFVPMDSFYGGGSGNYVYDSNYVGAYHNGEESMYDGSSGFGANL